MKNVKRISFDNLRSNRFTLTCLYLIDTTLIVINFVEDILQKEVKDILNKWEVNLSDIHIILDDVDLPLGKLRLRPKGGDGCHRGMESIIYHLGNVQFPRLRFGIATNDTLRPAEKYVLKSFKKKDQVLADEMIVRAADVAESIINEGLSITMNKFNS